MLKYIGAAAMLCCLVIAADGQSSITGKVFDAASNEPVSGATVMSIPDRQIHATDKSGSFTIHPGVTCDSLYISSSAYVLKKIAVGTKSNFNISMQPAFGYLNEVIISADREKQRRTEAPVAINVLTKATIEETKATRLDMLINKIPGAFMVDLGNEQHSMAMRQPLGYGNLYLYLEDGIPIRTVGDFNHNALIEINQAALQKIEVIKGPASSLYGSEAVGGAFNFITPTPTLFPSGKVQVEGGNRGYKRTDVSFSHSYKKWGFFVGGYYANQNQADNQHNDFNKGAITAKLEYHFSDKTKLTNTIDFIRYHTDQKGGLDSLHFYNKDYQSNYRFTYRKVNSLRIRSTLAHQWSETDRTSFTLFLRDASIKQNPFYYIGNVPNNPLKANGQVNEDAFKSIGTVIQHVKDFKGLRGKWITGVSLDVSPATYWANYIDIDRDQQGVYYQYQVTDSVLTDYNVHLYNSALYTQFEVSPLNKLKIVAAARYDRLDYRFNNHLEPGAYTGAPDTKDHFDHFTPKLGLTYDLGKASGGYLNYSVGFAPPNITDLYTGVKVPELQPATYRNYELGGWLAFANNKGYAELSVYQLDGTNEIISVRLDDNSYQNKNAGRTRHRGIEINTRLQAAEDFTIRVGGTIAEHRYIDYVLQGKSFSGNLMAQSPRYIANAEFTYKPHQVKGLRLALEYQGLGKYYTDPANTATYKGLQVANLRTGYNIKALELWINCLNLTNANYATTVEKSVYGTSYRPGQLRTINLGLAYRFGNIE